MRIAFLLGLALVFTVGDPANAVAPKPPAPGRAIDYGPMAFFPNRWKEQEHSTQLFPWEGKQVVLLTTKKDLDPKVIEVFLDRLDGGWKYYADMVGQSPRPGKLLKNKPTIAVVPDGRLTCGYGCGLVGATGIEVAGFDGSDYPLVVKNPKAFPHYYFYEMGRNYFVFGDRHSAFTTGYAVFMRYCCMDALKCEDAEAKVRDQIEQAEGHYAKSNMPFLQAFTTQGGLDEKVPRLKDMVGPSDQPVMYASAMLKLRNDYGGDGWVKRFCRQLATCPEVKSDTPEGALYQSVMWLAAASVAASEDLTPLFVDRWRLPVGEKTRKALKQIEWKAQELTAITVLQSLPDDVTK